MTKVKKSKLETRKMKISPSEQEPTPVVPDAKRRKMMRTQDTEEKAMEDLACQGEEELAPEVKRKMERKLKKERKKEERRLLREAGVLVEKKKPQKASACDLALKYLSMWSEKHKEWRFQKIRQTWLLQHMYDCDQISDEHFTLLLGYLEGLKGNARDLTIQKTEALIKESDSTDDPTVFSQEKIERMRQVLQILS
ncbi:cholesin-like isoform X2 [Hemitrygon akajei]|uniref:cholesin-like isoform X2 n=1 Tax=Hemitrygon akajei TaxID=2704970 RepID=UPI003BF9B0F2